MEDNSIFFKISIFLELSNKYDEIIFWWNKSATIEIYQKLQQADPQIYQQ